MRLCMVISENGREGTIEAWNRGLSLSQEWHESEARKDGGGARGREGVPHTMAIMLAYDIGQHNRLAERMAQVP